MYKIKALSRLTMLIITSLSVNVIAFDKFDNDVCESMNDANSVILCFRDTDLEKSCRDRLDLELACYRNAASKILSEQRIQLEKTQQAEEQAKDVREKKEYFYRSRMSPSAITPYTLTSAPETFARFGTRIKQVEVLREKASEMVLDSGKCGFVELVELSLTRSSMNNLAFWVYCSNQQRFDLDEKQINSSSKVLTLQEKSWNESDALKACQNAILANVSIPSSVDFHALLGTRIHKAELTYNVLVEIDFDAKNGLGISMPYTAKCIFPSGGHGELTITKR